MDHEASPPSLADRVVIAFGGLTLAALALDVPLTTVDGWRRSGRIPRWRLPAIREAATRKAVALPEDFPQEDSAAA